MQRVLGDPFAEPSACFCQCEKRTRKGCGWRCGRSLRSDILPLPVFNVAAIAVRRPIRTLVSSRNPQLHSERRTLPCGSPMVLAVTRRGHSKRSILHLFPLDNLLRTVPNTTLYCLVYQLRYCSTTYSPCPVMSRTHYTTVILLGKPRAASCVALTMVQFFVPSEILNTRLY
jgi:hypothetical protein